MAVKMVMGVACAGKTHFINTYFPEYKKLDVFDYQEELLGEQDEKVLSEEEYIEKLQEANDRIRDDLVAAVMEGYDVVVEHTLFKAKRRRFYVEAVRAVSDATIELYVMQPTKHQLLDNVLKRGGSEEDIFEMITQFQSKIELPDFREGFDKIYYVKNDGIFKVFQRRQRGFRLW